MVNFNTEKNLNFASLQVITYEVSKIFYADINRSRR